MKEKGLIEEEEEGEISLEKELYPYVEEFFRKELGLETVDFDTNNTLSVKLFGSKIRPDVYGINEDENNMLVVMAEGKWDFHGRNFDMCKGQGVSLQRFADKVYLFVRKESWNSLNKKDRKQITDELKRWGLGLLTVDTINKKCEQILKPPEKNKLLDPKKKEDVFYEISEKFSKYDNEKFNKLCSASARKNCRDSLWVMERVKEVSFFKKLSILLDEEYGFNFRMDKWLGNKKFSSEETRIRICIYPFGDDISEDFHQQPTLVLWVQNWDMANYLKDKKFRDKLRNLVSNNHSVLISWAEGNEEIERLEIKKWDNSKAEHFKDFLNNSQIIAMQAYFYVKPLLGQNINDIIKSTDTILKEITEIYRLKY